MKKTLIALMGLAGVAMGAATVPAWTVVDNHNGTVTYTTTLYGGYDISLGDAAITGGESFTLSVLQTSSVWMEGTDYGCGLVGTSNPLNQYGSKNNHQNDNFSVYLGASKNDTKVRWSINNWTYANEGCNVGNKDSVFTADYTDVPGTINETTPLTLGIVLTYDSTAGSRSLTMAAHEDSHLQFNTHTEATNFPASYNFSTLTNINAEYNNTYGQPATAVTIISITKAGSLIPEPTTATLSLLALAGLAARRRRK